VPPNATVPGTESEKYVGSVFETWAKDWAVPTALVYPRIGQNPGQWLRGKASGPRYCIHLASGRALSCARYGNPLEVAPWAGRAPCGRI